MADSKLYAEDEVTGTVKVTLVKDIFHSKLRTFATLLDFEQAEIEGTIVATASQEEQSMSIINKWLEEKAKDVTVGYLVEQLNTWQKSGYVSRNIWKHLSELIHLDDSPTGKVARSKTAAGGVIQQPETGDQELTDIMMLDVGEEFMEWMKVERLGLLLGLEKSKIGARKTNDKYDVGSAAYNIIQDWFATMETRQQAYGKLKNVLKQMNETQIIQNCL